MPILPKDRWGDDWVRKQALADLHRKHVSEGYASHRVTKATHRLLADLNKKYSAWPADFVLYTLLEKELGKKGAQDPDGVHKPLQRRVYK